jgi:hypothetical protein
MSRSNYSQDLTGNINSTNNVGNTGINTDTIYRVLIIALIVFVIIGFIPSLQNMYDTISASLSVLSIILLIVTTYLTTLSDKKTNILSTVRQSFSIVDQCKSSLVQFISQNSSTCPELINSLYFDFQKQDPAYYKPLPLLEEGDDYSSVNTFCNLLYQNVQDSLSGIKFTYTQKSQLLTYFAKLFVSPIVQKHWNTNWYSHYVATSLLINNLIYIVTHYTFKNALELDIFFMVYSHSKKYLYISFVNDPL